jgi:hypothetical protein
MKFKQIMSMVRSFISKEENMYSAFGSNPFMNADALNAYRKRKAIDAATMPTACHNVSQALRDAARMYLTPPLAGSAPELVLPIEGRHGLPYLSRSRSYCDAGE